MNPRTPVCCDERPGWTAALLVAVFAPIALVLVPLVAGVAWARVLLRQHTVPQVAVGIVVGAAVAGSVMNVMAH